MTFASPVHLVALLAIPAVAAAYAIAGNRRRRYALRFPAASVFARVADRQPLLRRALAPALLAAAAAALAVSFAKPQATVAVPVEKASVALVTDESGSMSATDVEPSRLAAAQSAAATFLDRVPKRLLVGFVGFSSQTNAVVEPSTNRAAVRTALDSLQADGATATGDALNSALDRLAARRGRDGRQAPAAVILLSDGKRTEGGDPLVAAHRAKELGIRVSTVALGTGDGTIPGPMGEPIAVPPDPDTLEQISHITGGTFTKAANANDLASIYKDLGSKVGTKRVQRDVSSSVAAAGLVLLLGGLGTGLRWRPRIA